MNHEKRMVTIHLGDGHPITTAKPDRNAKCKCGSGKKQKNCCGVSTGFFSTKPKDKPMFKTDGDGVEHQIN